MRFERMAGVSHPSHVTSLSSRPWVIAPQLMATNGPLERRLF
jgi:hypothetical protein